GLEQLPEAGLVFEVGAGGVAEAVTLAAIARSETLGHGELGRIGEAPIFADAAVQPFGAGFGGFDGERLEAVGFEVVAVVLGFFAALADAFAGGHDNKGDVIALAVLGREDIIAEAEKIAEALALEIESVQRRCRTGREKMQRVAFGFGFEKLPDGANLHEFGSFVSYFFHRFE